MLFRRVTSTLAALICATHVAAQDIIVIGDSILDWNEGSESIPGALSDMLGVPVDDRAVSGAEISVRFWLRWKIPEIRAQLGDDRPAILVMNGGGNDLNNACGCQTGCAAEAAKLLRPDGSGELGDFLQDVTAAGTRIVYLGYAPPPVSGNVFSGCMAALSDLADRIAAMPNVTFVPVDGAINPQDPTHYDPDRLHPSPKGGAIMAALLADAIQRLP